MVEQIAKKNQKDFNSYVELHAHYKTYEVAWLEGEPVGIIFDKGLFIPGQLILYKATR